MYTVSLIIFFSCSLKLKKFAILEKKYQNLKDDLLNSLKSQKTLYKRKRNKIYINQDEVGEDEEISQMEIHQLTEEKYLEVSQNFEARLELFQYYLEIIKSHHTKGLYAKRLQYSFSTCICH